MKVELTTDAVAAERERARRIADVLAAVDELLWADANADPDCWHDCVVHAMRHLRTARGMLDD